MIGCQVVVVVDGCLMHEAAAAAAAAAGASLDAEDGVSTNYHIHPGYHIYTPTQPLASSLTGDDNHDIIASITLG